jgi:hypothetical protein
LRNISEAQPIRWPAPLTDDSEVAVAECVVPNQLVVGVRQRQQALPLCGGKNGATWHI